MNMAKNEFADEAEFAQRESVADISIHEPLTARLDEILNASGLSVRLTIGSYSLVIGQKHSARAVTEFIFKSPAVAARLLKRLRLYDFVVAYLDGYLEVRGPISGAIDILDAMNVVTDQRQTILEYLQFWAFRISKAFVPSIAVRFESLDHYSQSARAYELFLDEYMQYTCGRFETGRENINEAQVEKFELIRRLIEAHGGSLSGKSHLDIGCGWGGMVVYFSKNFGTRSIGNTNCAPQVKYASRRFAVETVCCDFGKLNDLGQKFDVITVVGMIEHLTPYRRSQLLDTIENLLNESGLVYLQCISKPQIWIGGDAYRLAEREVFRGHFLEYRQQTEERLRRKGFAILEAFDHGFDYGLTTALWVKNIEANKDALIKLLGERQYRLYLGYLAFGSKLFSTGRGSLMRYVFKRATG